MTWGSDTLGAITVGLILPEGVNGFQNRNVTIEGNRIDDSYIYAIFVGNADGVPIINNAIGQTFIRCSAFDVGGRFGIHPESAILIGTGSTAFAGDDTPIEALIVEPVLS